MENKRMATEPATFIGNADNILAYDPCCGNVKSICEL